ncbi:MAG: VC0807 family protein [Actinomycetota bacterium]
MVAEPRTNDEADRRVGTRFGAVRMVLLDIVGPLVVFQLARSVGIAEVWALVLSGLPPAIGVCVDWQRRRKIEVIGIVVLGGIALSLALAMLSDDPKVVLLEGAAVTAVLAIAQLVSIRMRRPLIFYFAQAFQGGRFSTAGMAMEAEYDEFVEARSFWRTAAIVWGIVGLAEAVARVFVIQLVSTSTALAINRIAPWLIFAGLIAWTYWAGTRARASGALDDDPQPARRDV